MFKFRNKFDFFDEFKLLVPAIATFLSNVDQKSNNYFNQTFEIYL